jgi:hypothetical protein
MLAELALSRAAQRTFAERFLAEEAKAAVQASRKQASRRAASAREALSAARMAASTLIGESHEAPVAVALASLELVSAFVTGELVVALERAGVEVFASAGGAASRGNKGGAKAETVDAVLDPRLPHLAALREGLPQIPEVLERTEADEHGGQECAKGAQRARAQREGVQR